MFIKAGGGGMKHHHAGRGGKAKRNGGVGGGSMGGMGGGGGGRRLNGHGMHMQLMQLGQHGMVAGGGGGGHMQTAHVMRHGKDGGGGMGGPRKMGRSTGFHTEPSSPTYAHSQYRSPAVSGASSMLSNQPNGYMHGPAAVYNNSYTSTSPPTAAHLSAQTALNALSLADGGQLRSTGGNNPVAMHQPHTFTRTQSNPAQSPSHSYKGGQGMAAGSGGYRGGAHLSSTGGGGGGYGEQQPQQQQLPYMNKGNRYRSSSANVNPHGGGGMVRRGGHGGYGGNPAHAAHAMHPQPHHHQQQQQHQPQQYAHHNQYQQ